MAYPWTQVNGVVTGNITKNLTEKVGNDKTGTGLLQRECADVLSSDWRMKVT